MNVATALIGLALGQPPAAATPDYYPLSSRTIKLPIKYEKDRKAIRQVKLYVSRNGENTWYQEAAVAPDRDSFTFVAKDDGIYWFTMVEEDLQGRNVPSDLTRTPPDLKVVVDTIQPRILITNAKRNGEEVVVEWTVEDKNPDENSVKVQFRPSGADGYWQEVTMPAGSRSGVRFASGTGTAIAVRVTVSDLAGNKTETIREVGPNAASITTTTSMSPLNPTVPPAGPGASPSGVIPLPDSLAPVAPPMSGTPGTGSTGIPPGTLLPISPGPAPSRTQPLPTLDPRTTSPAGSAPIPVWSGPHATGAPTVEVSRANTINYLAFDLGYDVESRGPSGISRVDLWITRDDGRSWQKWSQYDAKGTSVRVNLNVPANANVEGAYGFRVVPISGAGLSEREPVAGDTPDLRVVVDVTPPQLDLFPPVGDPNNPEMLVIQWKSADRNFGDDPISIEWSDRATGPWQSVVSSGDGVQFATASSQLRRIANTGSFAWRVPTGLSPRVYLRVIARDAAGNEKTIVTRDPILVDLMKPRAKINGIIGPVVSPRP